MVIFLVSVNVDLFQYDLVLFCKFGGSPRVPLRSVCGVQNPYSTGDIHTTTTVQQQQHSQNKKIKKKDQQQQQQQGKGTTAGGGVLLH